MLQASVLPKVQEQYHAPVALRRGRPKDTCPKLPNHASHAMVQILSSTPHPSRQAGSSNPVIELHEAKSAATPLEVVGMTLARLALVYHAGCCKATSSRNSPSAQNVLTWLSSRAWPYPFPWESSSSSRRGPGPRIEQLAEPSQTWAGNRQGQRKWQRSCADVPGSRLLVRGLARTTRLFKMRSCFVISAKSFSRLSLNFLGDTKLFHTICLYGI